MALVGSITQAHELREQLLNRQSGKWLLTQNNPNEFDYYMVALELLKSDLSTSKYFVFPILPNAIQYNDTAITKINKTAGGISILKSSQFNIKNITISGNFGKNFKVLIGNTYQDLLSTFKDKNTNSDKKSIVGGIIDSFSNTIKTGYGCCKVLEDILQSSNQKDEFGGAQFLVFYNLAFNQKYFVEFEEQSFSQNIESNMIWNYSVRLKAVGQVDNFIKSKLNKKSIGELTVGNTIQQKANQAYSVVNKILSKTYSGITSKL